MYYVIYTSLSKTDWTPNQLKALLATSQSNNQAKEITGMLVLMNNRFIQLLEGDRSNVTELYNKIKEDKRHERVTTLLEGNIENRLFNGWSMGFKAIESEEFKTLSGYSNLEDFFNKQVINDDSHPAIIFLKLFYTKNIRDLQYL